jgi:hypothetical protein
MVNTAGSFANFAFNVSGITHIVFFRMDGESYFEVCHLTSVASTFRPGSWARS